MRCSAVCPVSRRRCKMSYRLLCRYCFRMPDFMHFHLCKTFTIFLILKHMSELNIHTKGLFPLFRSISYTQHHFCHKRLSFNSTHLFTPFREEPSPLSSPLTMSPPNSETLEAYCLWCISGPTGAALPLFTVWKQWTAFHLLGSHLRFLLHAKPLKKPSPLSSHQCGRLTPRSVGEMGSMSSVTILCVQDAALTCVFSRHHFFELEKDGFRPALAGLGAELQCKTRFSPRGHIFIFL